MQKLTKAFHPDFYERALFYRNDCNIWEINTVYPPGVKQTLLLKGIAFEHLEDPELAYTHWKPLPPSPTDSPAIAQR